jgi:hypothetical protein
VWQVGVWVGLAVPVVFVGTGICCLSLILYLFFRNATCWFRKYTAVASVLCESPWLFGIVHFVCLHLFALSWSGQGLSVLMLMHCCQIVLDGLDFRSIFKVITANWEIVEGFYGLVNLFCFWS